MEYKILYKDGRAKRAEMKTVHGTIQTPVFMNVGTVAAIKGAVSTDDLRTIGTQVELSNTYHLHVRTGDKLIRQFGGLHKFMNWDRPILTDSGGFQVFSLAGLRKIKEEGVYFNSHIDGHKIFMGPEESMQIQSNLGSTIAMAFDECPTPPNKRSSLPCPEAPAAHPFSNGAGQTVPSSAAMPSMLPDPDFSRLAAHTSHETSGNCIKILASGNQKCSKAR